eukprot:GFYU01000158.1.p1 GENE.GFYU01000158.1~~GFYU01000158.1.p1  ORF type:complete len:134 (-),score=24.77 GFYU01000158.1:102-503(-)
MDEDEDEIPIQAESPIQVEIHTDTSRPPLTHDDSQDGTQTPHVSDVDFTKSSECWMRNKKKLKGGFYTYVCGVKRRTKNGYCRKQCANAQSHKARMRDPTSMMYTAGLRQRVIGLEWMPCIAHMRCGIESLSL